MRLIDGRTIAQTILEKVKNDVEISHLKPFLKIFNVGNNPSSLVYMNKKKQKGEEIGIKVEIEQFPEDVEISIVEEAIQKASSDVMVSGIIIQLPVKNFKIKSCFQLIPTSKDVDCLNPTSLGLLWQNDKKVLIPATVKAIVKVLENISSLEKASSLKEFLTGKNVLIINRSLIIGKPLSAVLLNNDATVTIAHSGTLSLENLFVNADIIVSATGQAGFINKFSLNKGVILIDAGFNYLNGKPVGDVFITPEIENQCSYLSPVPSGIGPISVSCLLENTLLGTKK